ncbi:response regulator [Massilia sp. H-1]|nr:response regulator [Massilia sp. H-1]
MSAPPSGWTCLACAQLAPPDLAAALAAWRVGRTRPSRTLSTLLYIEDNPGNLRLVEEIVRPRTDLRLLSAAEGHAGIALARQHLPHVILVDIHLPGIDGFEIRRLLRADPRTARIPVIAMTARAMPSDIARGKEAGFYSYLTKPIDIDLFSSVIDRAGRAGPQRGRSPGLAHRPRSRVPAFRFRRPTCQLGIESRTRPVDTRSVAQRGTSKAGTPFPLAETCMRAYPIVLAALLCMPAASANPAQQKTFTVGVEDLEYYPQKSHKGNEFIGFGRNCSTPSPRAVATSSNTRSCP